MEYFVLQNTRLSIVMKMAREIVNEIVHVLPIQNLQIAVSKVDRRASSGSIIAIRKIKEVKPNDLCIYGKSFKA